MQNFAHFFELCAQKALFMRIKIGIFASGSGTNAENIIRYFSEKPSFQVTLIVSNKEDAYVLERARKFDIPAIVCSKMDFLSTNKVVDILRGYKIDFIILAGFLLRIPENIIHIYPNRIVNIHPALLPKYGGKGMYGDHVHEAVVKAGEHESGITIHYINERYDEGNIIFQVSCRVLPSDTPHDVAEKVHALEYKYYPRVIEDVLQTVFT